MKKFEDLTPMVTKKRVSNSAHVRGFVEGMLLVTLLVVLFFMKRPDMVWATFHKDNVETAQHAKNEAEKIYNDNVSKVKTANEIYNEAMSNVFIKE